MPRNIVAFVGANENGILTFQSRAFMDRLRPLGFVGHVVDLSGPDGNEQLIRLLREGIDFAWGYAGVGATTKGNDRNLWDAIGVPFVSVLADPPSAIPVNHFIRARRVVNGYVYRDWLNVQRRLIRSPQVSALLPMGVIPNEQRDAVPWTRREHRMVFVKTGADPEARRAIWRNWPRRLRDALENAGAELCRRGTEDITPTALACFEANDLFLEERKDLLHGMLFQLDLYVRAVRATAMARALQDIPATIVGDGWEHVREPGCRARFLPSMPASSLDDLYANCQWLVNTTPNFSSGAHERVLRGFAAKCCVVSDDNDFSRGRLRGLPSYRGVEWHEKTLGDRLAEIHGDPTAYDDALQPALDLVEREHDPLAFMQAVMSLAEIGRLNGLEAFDPESAS
jgi:hypothetical protein